MGLISNRANFSNIGHRLDSFEWIRQKWNPRYHQVNTLSDTGLPPCSNNKYLLKRSTSPILSYAVAADANRNWTSPYQDIVVFFSCDMQDAALTANNPATGHTISINGTPQTTNYQSGSGSDTWTLRVPVLFDYSDAITYSYDQTAGNTTSVTWGTGTEMITTTNRVVSNQLTERIRFTLRRASGDLATNETIKLAVNIYNAGSVDVIGTTCAPYNNQWMKQEMSLTTTTDANGVVDVAYTGASTVAGTVYIVVFRPDTSPTESMAWVDTVK